MSFLSPLNLPSLSAEQVEQSDLPVTKEEIIAVIKHLPSGKAPGMYGFTAKFYKTYSEDLAQFLLDMYNESFDRGRLPPSLSEAIISLILKDGKDPLECKNYRPISLISCDSKILSKILTNRLDKAIAFLIHPDQVGFIRT